MSKHIQDQPTTTSQPTNFFVNLAGVVSQLTWAGFTALLNALYVPLTRTVNGKALSADVSLDKTDVGLANVTNDAQLKASQLDTDVTMAANSDALVPSQAAAKAYTDAKVAAIVDSSPATLDTLNELAAALGDDANFATTVTTALAAKAPLASPALTGTPTAPTASAATNTTQIATTAYVQANLATKANLASPALTGTPTAPTASTATNNTQIATTAYVQANLSSKANLASPALTGTPTAPTAAAGTNNTQLATTAFVAAAVAAGGGGGASISTPGIAYVTSGGSDVTGTIGNPGKPFATLQQAYDQLRAGGFSGAITLDIGVGTFGVLTTSGNLDLCLLGKGVEQSICSALYITEAGTVHLRGNGLITVGDVTIDGPTGATGSNGDPSSL